ncbi:MAG: hypothetical protein J6O62_00250 [Bacilli bacterium]|nr:hypothetical protein [Bacilli bacterium]
MKKLEKDNYDLYGNKLYIFTDNINGLNLKKIGEGTEGKIYILDKKHLIKIYRPNLLEEQEDIYNEYRIEEIAKRRNLVKNTHLVYGPVFINGEFSGALTHFHRYSPNLDILDYIPSKEYKINKFLEINENLHELEKNGIYYVDLTPKNVLLPKLKKIRIIDTDGKSTKLEDYDKDYYRNKMYENLYLLILEKLFYFDIESYEDEDHLDEDYLEELFQNTKINPDILSEIRHGRFNYELMKQFLIQLKEEKKLELKMAQ